MMLGVCSGLVLAAVYVWSGPLRASHPSIWTLMWGATCYLCLALLPLALLVGQIRSARHGVPFVMPRIESDLRPPPYVFSVYVLTSGSIGFGTWYVPDLSDSSEVGLPALTEPMAAFGWRIRSDVVSALGRPLPPCDRPRRTGMLRTADMRRRVIVDDASSGLGGLGIVRLLPAMSRPS